MCVSKRLPATFQAGSLLLLFLITTIAPSLIAGRSEPVIWVWSGAVTSESAVVKTKIRSDVSEVRLVLSPESDFGQFTTYPEKGFA